MQRYAYACIVGFLLSCGSTSAATVTVPWSSCSGESSSAYGDSNEYWTTVVAPNHPPDGHSSCRWEQSCRVTDGPVETTAGETATAFASQLCTRCNDNCGDSGTPPPGGTCSLQLKIKISGEKSFNLSASRKLEVGVSGVATMEGALSGGVDWGGSVGCEFNPTNSVTNAGCHWSHECISLSYTKGKGGKQKHTWEVVLTLVEDKAACECDHPCNNVGESVSGIAKEEWSTVKGHVCTGSGVSGICSGNSNGICDGSNPPPEAPYPSNFELAAP